MKEQIKYGGWRYVSFIVLDLILLLFANFLAAVIYLRTIPTYSFHNYASVVLIMLALDLTVNAVCDTLSRVLRRNLKKELTRGAKHIGICFVVLCVALFSFRQGAEYSRVTVFLAYFFYYLLYVGGHTVWKALLRKTYKKESNLTAFLMSTDRFAEEGLEELNEINISVRYIWLLKNINKDEISGVPVVKTWEEASAAICWKNLDKVYIYGLDHQMVPPYLIKACREMGLKINLVDFNFKVIDIKSIPGEEPKYGFLNVLEGKRDLPFPIRRAYWITETEAGVHRGFHSHKLNCQLLYCPYGEIEIIMDDGQMKSTVTLDRPNKGLIMMPGLWREMIWKQTGSVLCVLASEYYDADEYIRDYDAFIAYNKEYRGLQ